MKTMDHDADDGAGLEYVRGFVETRLAAGHTLASILAEFGLADETAVTITTKEVRKVSANENVTEGDNAIPGRASHHMGS
jgi:hypothetical protein